MPALSCSATTCIYNKQELCSKGDVKIGGSNARQAGETCCESFQERSQDSMMNSMASGCGCTNIGVNCDATGCRSNDHCKCVAGAINIDGHDACCMSETCCSSFMRGQGMRNGKHHPDTECRVVFLFNALRRSAGFSGKIRDFFLT